MGSRDPGGGERGLIAGERRTVSRYFTREREKQELRRERDAMMLRIAGEFGEATLAERLHSSPAVVDKLLADARERLGGGSSGSAPTITVRRARAERDRWADIDTYYEALGSRPQTFPRRRFRPRP